MSKKKPLTGTKKFSTARKAAVPSSAGLRGATIEIQPSQADAKSFERGHSMAVDFMQSFEPGELKPALQGFLSSCRSRLTEQMTKHDNLSTLAAEALGVVEER